ncbi:MAG: O-antigen ligase family protein [Fuerstiella sp.]
MSWFRAPPSQEICCPPDFAVHQSDRCLLTAIADVPHATNFIMRILGVLSGTLAVIVALLTVAALPWLLGGVIPLARAILLLGAVVAGLLSLLANLLRWQFSASLPLILLPLCGLAVLGTWQLRPVDEPAAAAMTSAVHQADRLPPTATAQSAAVIAADTRLAAATLLSLAVLCCVCFDQIRTRRLLLLTCGVLLVNGTIIAGLGLSQLFREGSIELNDFWSLGGQNPFGTFVNPNGAAGWLCLCFAVAAGWLAFHVKAATSDHHSGFGQLQTSLWQRGQQRLVQLLADLTAWQILAVLSVAFFGAAVAATMSRGGILALLVAVAVTVGCRSSVRRLPLIGLTLLIVSAGILGLLNWLQLGEDVVVEMKTLQNLNAAAGGRPRHWLDSLQAVQDFPLTGTGLGSYRFATLPYQTQHTALWFRNADNQFVEMVVEGGILGLLMFVGIGVFGLLTGMAAWKQSRRRVIAYDSWLIGLSRPLFFGLGTAAILATLTQAVSGVFDYGIGMPPAASLLIVIIAVVAGTLEEADSAVSEGRATVRCGRLVSFSIQLCLISSAAVYAIDLKAAAEVDQSVVAGSRLLSDPVTPDDLDRLPTEVDQLKTRLKRRPDDPEGLRMLSRLAAADFRWRVMLADSGPAVRRMKGFEMAWRKFSVFFLAGRTAHLSQTDPVAAADFRQLVLTALQESQLPQVLERVQRRFPLMPSISETRAEIAVLLNDEVLFDQQVRHAVFVNAANAETCFRTGLLALRWGRTELCKDLWQRSIRLSEEYQAPMLAEAQQKWGTVEAMRLFGPQTYSQCVRSARNCRDPKLKQELYERAELMWAQDDIRRKEDVELLRASHLAATERVAEAIDFLKVSVQQRSRSIPLRRQLAEHLEQQGRYLDALAEWHTIQYLDVDDATAAAAIQRLRNVK